MVIAKSVKH